MKACRLQAEVRVGPGFTLIELLVVVLIIGILAAVAIPQYFKVVERGRAAEAKNFVDHIAQAEERYYNSRGSYELLIGNLQGAVAGDPGLDINIMGNAACQSYAGAGTANCGMANFGITNLAAGVPCNGGNTGFTVTLTRCSPQGANCASSSPTRYGVYTLVYNNCPMPTFTWSGNAAVDGF